MDIQIVFEDYDAIKKLSKRLQFIPILNGSNGSNKKDIEVIFEYDDSDHGITLTMKIDLLELNLAVSKLLMM